MRTSPTLPEAVRQCGFALRRAPVWLTSESTNGPLPTSDSGRRQAAPTSSARWRGQG